MIFLVLVVCCNVKKQNDKSFNQKSFFIISIIKLTLKIVNFVSYRKDEKKRNILKIEIADKNHCEVTTPLTLVPPMANRQ